MRPGQAVEVLRNPAELGGMPAPDRGQRAAIEAQMTTEGQHFGAMLAAPEAREAFAAFFEKRKPDFSRFV